jgi:general nucleoside transport system permease protein
VSEPLAPQHGPQPEEIAQDAPLTPASRLAAWQRAGGIITPVITALVAFLIGGVVIAATGHNPFQAYWDIINGAGFNWLAHPWDTDIAHTAPYNFSQTLLQTTTLILCGLAVAFAFRCGLFNIGGNGQYIVGLICANWVGVSFVNMARPAHILLGIAVAAAAGAVWAGIAGFLKATVGAHEVITTIMLNWIAYWLGVYVFQQGGPLQAPKNVPLDIPISADVVPGAQLPVFWGIPALQGLHIGFFIAIGMLVVFWVILNRTTLGFEVRAVGFNPDAAAYGGIKVRTNYLRAMAISGAFAGLAGGIDMLGYLHHYGTIDVQATTIGFLGIAVALLGRNTAVGVGIAALLFGGLVYGTTHGLQSGTIDPSLAGHLTEIIQGLVVLFVGADVLIIAVWNSRRKLRRREPQAPARAAEAET